MAAEIVTRIVLAFCVVGLATGAARAKTRVEQNACLQRCTQAMKACYRINDVIYIDHCDQQYRRCLMACARG
jgi:hypothetical protein